MHVHAHVCIVRGGTPGRDYSADVLDRCAQRAHKIAEPSNVLSFKTVKKIPEGRFEVEFKD